MSMPLSEAVPMAVRFAQSKGLRADGIFLAYENLSDLPYSAWLTYEEAEEDDGTEYLVVEVPGLSYDGHATPEAAVVAILRALTDLPDLDGVEMEN